ncbi:chemotaxis protein [Actinoplanes sp. SE50]|uniref:response regulator n=1 Tax=unclassified Actinoplanes TaxID=2626549 RepID=UPI00023ECFC5|nr:MULTISPECIES: response regulator [unclassified Actinoplanes]AEV82133.1 Chemotaxis response regulator protein-glutamate methylesterase [Actinoplanes sp. SE50/110]ATO80532.1 chemotaxis protein [Actinoplanes sp. SE50]SLL97938.1 response regulatorcontaining CheY-like receiver domain and a GAF sensor-domain [Actinoplanes sp. SE50/110]
MASIVIAEDDRDIAELLATVLSNADHSVRTVPTGAAALEAIGAETPDLVILDHHMPGMSGLEVADRLRAEAATAGLPLIMLSAATPAAARHLCDLTISKPVRPRMLLEAVGELLAARVDGGPPADIHPDAATQLADVPRLLAVSDLLTRPAHAAGLDAFAERLAGLTGVPTAAITLMLNDTVVVAGSFGLPRWVREAGGVPAEWSPDTIVVAEDVPVLIGDSRENEEYADTPLFSVSGVRSYASVPLHSPEGHIVGTLCVMDERPGSCTEDTVQTLHSQRAAALGLLLPAGA